MFVLSSTGTYLTSQLGRKQLPSSRNCSLQDTCCVLTYVPEDNSPSHHKREVTTRENPYYIHTVLMLGRGLIFLPLCQVPLAANAGDFQCSAQAANSIWDRIPQSAANKIWDSIPQIAAKKYGTGPTKLLSIRYGTASHKATANKIWNSILQSCCQ